MKITIPPHAVERMLQRGATEQEVLDAIREGTPTPVKSGRFASRKTFNYNSISPVNHRRYIFKTVEAIWAEEPDERVLVTVKVYYHNSV